MCTISMRTDENKKELIKKFATTYGMNVSEFILSTVMERIEDELDAQELEQIIKDNKHKEKTYTTQQVAKELNIKI